MSRLSDTSRKLIQVIRDFPGLDGQQIKHNHFADSNQTGNNIKLLETHGYIEYIEADNGWYLTKKGAEVIKYG